MEKDGVRVVSIALASLLSATACGASSPITGKYVGEGAKCSTYTMANGVSTELAITIIDPVMDPRTNKLLLPNGRDTTLFNCTEAKTQVSVTVCTPNKAKDALSCQRVGGGTILGSIYAPPPRKPGDTWHEQYGTWQTHHQGAGWSSNHRN